MEVTKKFLTNVSESDLRYWKVQSYQTGEAEEEQHPSFPLSEMPIFTFLDDTDSAFVYVTFSE